MIRISDAEFRAAVPMGDAIDAVRRAFIALARGDVDQPPRLAMSDGSLLAMAARVADGGSVAKLVSVRERNRISGLPTIQTIVVWFTAETGRPVAIIEGESLTSIRTAAASGVATDLFARPEATILAMIGAGALAADQIRAVVAVRPITEVRVLSRHAESSARFVEALRPEFPRLNFKVVTRPAEALRDADVVCTATTATHPVFEDTHVPAGCHINALGAFRPAMREIPPQLLSRARVVAVDQVSAALAEAGDVIQAIDGGWIGATDLVEIGNLLGSSVPWEARSVTVFKSVGVAVQDWAVAALAVERLVRSEVPS